ncbi:MAG: bacillithiol biosynthesis deacetylase BshB1 [Candidatus Caldatribacteriota bacterium]|nr:bacillithiol biosynthesis deacetylase BshB1 [Candidatus Caldatribacteriota bacterium]
MLNILAISPHPDDVELGMGGSILKFTNVGHQITILDLSDGESASQGDSKTRKKESIKSSRILGIEERITLDFPNNYLQDEIESREELAKIIRNIRPDIIFAPYWVDANPDHIAASKLCDSARFLGKLTNTEIKGKPFYIKKAYYYSASRSKLNFNPSFIIDISEEMEMKMEAIKAYESQFGPSAENHQIFELISNNNYHLGNFIGTKFGEAFITREEICLRNIEAIF